MIYEHLYRKFQHIDSKSQHMENNHLTKTPELSPSRPSPFVSSAKLVIGVGFSVLGLVGKAIKGAAGLLVNRTGNARNTRKLSTNKHHTIRDTRDF